MACSGQNLKLNSDGSIEYTNSNDSTNGNVFSLPKTDYEFGEVVLIQSYNGDYNDTYRSSGPTPNYIYGQNNSSTDGKIGGSICGSDYDIYNTGSSPDYDYYQYTNMIQNSKYTPTYTGVEKDDTTTKKIDTISACFDNLEDTSAIKSACSTGYEYNSSTGKCKKTIGFSNMEPKCSSSYEYLNNGVCVKYSEYYKENSTINMLTKLSGQISSFTSTSNSAKQTTAKTKAVNYIVDNILFNGTEISSHTENTGNVYNAVYSIVAAAKQHAKEAADAYVKNDTGYNGYKDTTSSLYSSKYSYYCKYNDTKDENCKEAYAGENKVDCYTEYTTVTGDKVKDYVDKSGDTSSTFYDFVVSDNNSKVVVKFGDDCGTNKKRTIVNDLTTTEEEEVTSYADEKAKTYANSQTYTTYCKYDDDTYNDKTYTEVSSYEDYETFKTNSGYEGKIYITADDTTGNGVAVFEWGEGSNCTKTVTKVADEDTLSNDDITYIESNAKAYANAYTSYTTHCKYDDETYTKAEETDNNVVDYRTKSGNTDTIYMVDGVAVVETDGECSGTEEGTTKAGTSAIAIDEWITQYNTKYNELKTAKLTTTETITGAVMVSVGDWLTNYNTQYTTSYNAKKKEITEKTEEITGDAMVAIQDWLDVYDAEYKAYIENEKNNLKKDDNLKSNSAYKSLYNKYYNVFYMYEFLGYGCSTTTTTTDGVTTSTYSCPNVKNFNSYIDTIKNADDSYKYDKLSVEKYDDNSKVVILYTNTEAGTNDGDSVTTTCQYNVESGYYCVKSTYIDATGSETTDDKITITDEIKTKINTLFEDYFVNKTISKIQSEVNVAISEENKKVATCEGVYADYFKAEKSYGKVSGKYNSGLFMVMQCTVDGWKVLDKPKCVKRCSGNTWSVGVNPTGSGDWTVSVGFANLRHSKWFYAYFAGHANQSCYKNGYVDHAIVKYECDNGTAKQIIWQSEKDGIAGWDRWYSAWNPVSHICTGYTYFSASDGGVNCSCKHRWQQRGDDSTADIFSCVPSSCTGHADRNSASYTGSFGPSGVSTVTYTINRN